MLAALALSGARGLGAVGDDGPALLPAEVVRLSADQVRTWQDADGSRWLLLEGNAAALHGTEGIRADAIGVHVTPTTRNGMDGFEVEVHAEGKARTTEPFARAIASRHTSFATARDPKLTAFGEGKIVRLDAAPTRVAILDRGFPDRVKTVAASKPNPAPEAAPAEVAAEHEVSLGAPIPVTEQAPPKRDPAVTQASMEVPKRDPEVRRAQDDGGGFAAPPILNPPDEPAVPPMGGADPFRRGDPDDDPEPLPDAPPTAGPGAVVPATLLPNTRRSFTVSGQPGFQGSQFEFKPGELTFVLRGGINVIADLPKAGPAGTAGYKTVDLSADQMVIFTQKSKKNPKATMNLEAGVQQDAEDPLQIYMEGNVRIRQDERQVAGRGDEKVFEAEQAYYDLRTERMLALKARIYTATPGLLAPLRTDGDVINQFREVKGYNRGKKELGKFIRVDKSSSTGSRFPIPGYRFESQSLEIEDFTVPLVDQTTGGKTGNGSSPRNQDKLTQFRAFNNFYYLGAIPIFYSPFTKFDSNFDPILRGIRFQTGNVFGQTVQFDLSTFRLLNIRKPTYVDNWNLDVDYLSYRGLGLGTELSWLGRDLIGEISDPYNKKKLDRDVDQQYYGYLDMWGLKDQGRDVLGPGPAVVTNGPPGAGKAGYQRTSVPAFQDFRGRVTLRHMQKLLGEDADDDVDLRYQVEASYLSDRNFLEEYYKRLFDTGLDQETLLYGIYQKQNRALTLLGEVNLQNWYTETQWLPKLEYTRLGDSVLGDWVNVSMRAGVDYANTHTASEVANKNTFAFEPYDPVSNTSGVLRTGRIYSAGQVDVPLNLGPVKVVPYVQGQLVGWDNQLGGVPLGRAWGAFGAKANILAWRTFEGPDVESELFNVHSLAHKANFMVDYRSAYSNVHLNRIGIQDDLDDNTSEFTRRYFAMTNYVGGLLPKQYDPRYLTLRRLTSPISGTTDVQDTIQTVRFGLHQRLQTKRGAEGKRRIIDYMTLDLDSTYFPNANRDNFGKSFGQNTYNYEWFLGDRTSFVSYGWFEFWKVQGQSIVAANPHRTNDPFGLNVITSGFSISRPPRGNVFLGYSIINTGPISTSALNLSYTYWLSPKWYMYVATSYDFGNAILLGTTFSVTKITKDYLTSVGLTVDPQRLNYTFAFEISPRFSPNVSFGSTAGQRFDSRFAPSQ